MQNYHKKKCGFFYVALICLILLLVGCSDEETPQGKPIVVSYINTQKTKLVEVEAYLTTERINMQLDEVLTCLKTPSSKMEYYAPLSQGIEVISRSVIGGHLTINFSEEYKQLDATTEILTRASLVKSLTQIEGIDRVTFFIKGEQLKDSLGKKVGQMTATMFLEQVEK